MRCWPIYRPASVIADRAIVTHYDKTAGDFLGTIHLAQLMTDLNYAANVFDGSQMFSYDYFQIDQVTAEE